MFIYKCKGDTEVGNKYTGFRKDRIQKKRIFRSKGHFGNPQIEILQ